MRMYNYFLEWRWFDINTFFRWYQLWFSTKKCFNIIYHAYGSFSSIWKLHNMKIQERWYLINSISPLYFSSNCRSSMEMNEVEFSRPLLTDGTQSYSKISLKRPNFGESSHSIVCNSPKNMLLWYYVGQNFQTLNLYTSSIRIMLDNWVLMLDAYICEGGFTTSYEEVLLFKTRDFDEEERSRFYECRHTDMEVTQHVD